jgi:hypothetical protein
VALTPVTSWAVAKLVVNKATAIVATSRDRAGILGFMKLNDSEVFRQSDGS